MISQAGIYKLTLLENKELVIVRDSNKNITAITTSGETIELNTDDNRPNYKNDLDSGDNNVVLNEHIKEFIISSLTEESFDEIEQLNNSIYGWIPIIEFMDNQKYIINTPFFVSIGRVNTQTSHIFKIELETRVKSLHELTLYLP